MLYLPLQSLTLWDFHILHALAQWQRTTGHRIRKWMSILGEFEALCCLAGLHHDHPDWCFPQVRRTDVPQLQASQIGHPLLNPDKCVRNDILISPPGHMLLVTGSNMSGKSTLLRAVGVNVVLAQAGGPVCARTMSLPPLLLGTSFRIRDSLADGVSYFMAELNQLKRIVDLADSCLHDNHWTLLYLLDEILLGTNINERQEAVKLVLQHLISKRAIGALATHDLSLADADELSGKTDVVHFRETFTEAEGELHMTFDYILKSGLAHTQNALKLLRLAGLPHGQSTRTKS
jgi:DNA mismatch repair ATPase MutS